ncbi:hypothetical protein FZC84_12825 [Rossellomorea vietnamensis]|uniref:Uncharacterized protein n=1 Tax=Rossellomorea vietnamensis TaxID=218284 RepID=A0A5D4MC63_9BACI|nr:hypothetical protein [Rossellomorea vietnamensis]TYR98903.1 hypothetical protein FZC84_12825 [Rossellomorea vietnamensis]
MTVLFGSVEYFERELNDYLVNQELSHLSIGQKIELTYTTIKEDIAHNFICSDTLREECLDNLNKAYKKVSGSLCVVN